MIKDGKYREFYGTACRIVDELSRENRDLFLGLDCDFYLISEFEKFVKKNNNLHELFTPDEIKFCKNRYSSLCGRYVVKRLVRQLCGDEVGWLQMNILPRDTSKPVMELPENVIFNITHEDDLVGAVVGLLKSRRRSTVGVDITKISRMRLIMQNSPSVIEKIFTKREIEEIGFEGIKASEKWAGKEAVLKALGIGVWHGYILKDVEILDEHNFKKIEFGGDLKEKVTMWNYNKWVLRMVGDENLVMAIALGLKGY